MTMWCVEKMMRLHHHDQFTLQETATRRVIHYLFFLCRIFTILVRYCDVHNHTFRSPTFDFPLYSCRHCAVWVNSNPHILFIRVSLLFIY